MGLLVGGLTCGFCVAVFMANAGGAWDNAKKYIESGAHGGKGTDAHKAAVVGDTVGDPFKDTSGPSLNILIKLMSMVSVVVAGLIVRYARGPGDLLDLGSRTRAIGIAGRWPTGLGSSPGSASPRALAVVSQSHEARPDPHSLRWPLPRYRGGCNQDFLSARGD